jgi:hypothetical protein
LQGEAERGAILLGEDVLTDVDLEIGRDPKGVGVESGVVQAAKGDAIRDVRFALWL